MPLSSTLYESVILPVSGQREQTGEKIFFFSKAQGHEKERTNNFFSQIDSVLRILGYYNK
jgi:hypothetical protein